MQVVPGIERLSWRCKRHALPTEDQSQLKSALILESVHTAAELTVKISPRTFSPFIDVNKNNPVYVAVLCTGDVFTLEKNIAYSLANLSPTSPLDQLFFKLSVQVIPFQFPDSIHMFDLVMARRPVSCQLTSHPAYIKTQRSSLFVFCSAGFPSDIRCRLKVPAQHRLVVASPWAWHSQNAAKTETQVHVHTQTHTTSEMLHA